jgi:tape measure domain-containing protein
MAKSNEVDLVVKARNEASKTLKAITKAFEEFSTAVDETKSASAKGNTTLGDLAATLLDLNKKAAGLKAMEEVAKNLDEASAAADRLEGTVRGSVAELAKLARESEEAAARANKLRGSLEAEERTLKALKDERRDAAKLLTQQAKALRDAERAQDAFNKTQNQRTRTTRGVGLDSGQAQTSARDSAAVFLAGALEEAKRASTAAQGAVAKLDSEIAQATQNIGQMTPAVKAAADQQRRLEGETEKQSAAFRTNKAALTEVRTELEQVRQVSAQVSAATGQQIVDQNRVAAAYAKTASELDRVQRLATVMSRFSSGSGYFTDPKNAAALQKQNAAIKEAEANWKALEAEARRLSQELKTTSGNVTVQVDAFNRVIAASKAARAEYNAQVAALGKMQGAAKSSFAEWARATIPLRNATQTLKQVAPAASSAATSIRATAQATTSLTQALQTSNNASRESLSFFQRIRGEVIALTASYIGLQGGANQLMKVVDATNTLEAAQSRLNVAFGGDQRRVAAELKFIENQANRLGITFDVLSTQYSKFAVAAQSANFTGQATRDIFLSVAEAGRVQRLSVDQLQGIFKALEQIISKGKVQAEELRGQLGDRMTGAFQLFADAIGVTTAELDEMLKKGEVVASEENLTGLATRLRELYGPELANALMSVNTEMGRFQNNIFQARVAIGEGGFVKAFADGLRVVNEALSSGEATEFFRQIGSALAAVTEALTAALPYFDDLAQAAALLVAVKVASWLTDFTGRLRDNAAQVLRNNSGLFSFATSMELLRGRWNGFVSTLRIGTSALVGVGRQIGAVGAQARTTGVGAAALGVGLRALSTVAGIATGAFRLLWLAIGGLPGLILTGVTFAVTSWLGRVTETNGAMTEHQRILGAVQEAYTKIEGTTGNIKDNIEGATEAQAIASVEKLREAYRGLLDDMESVVSVLQDEVGRMGSAGAGSPQAAQLREIEDALNGLRNGTTTVEQFTEALNQIALTPASEEAKAVALELLNMTNAAADGESSLLDLNTAIEKGEAILRAFRGEAEEADEALLSASDAFDLNAKKAATAEEKSKAFNTAMEEMGQLIPEIAEELERLEQITALEKLYQDAAQAAKNFGELHAATQRYNQALEAINMDALGGTGLEASAGLIKQFEGFRETPYWDVNAFRVGYGSDTVTLADGTVQRVVEGMRVSVQDANRDLIRRIGEFQGTVKSEIGSDRFGAFSKEQQAVLTSIAYNYGNLTRTGELDAFKNGSVEEIAAAIRRLATQNGGVNSGRRNQEADLFEQGGTSYQLEQQQFELQTKANDLTKKRIEDQKFEVQQQQQINDGKAREAAIEAAVREAREENKKITEEQLATVRELAGQEFDLKNVKTEQKELQAQANAELAKAKALYQEQVALQQLLKQQQLSGDTEGVSATNLKLEETKTKLQEAIANARQFWEQIGGAEAQAKLTTLDTLNTKLQTATTRTGMFGLTTQQVSGFVDSFASGIANAFGAFAQAVVNGENAFKAFGQAVLQTLSQILIEIGVAIIRMTILKALSGFGGPIGAAAGGILSGVAHGGGVAGSTNRSRRVSSAALATPFVYHQGGVAGLKSNEISATLERGETIRTEEQEAALADKQAAAEAALANSGGAGTIRNIITLDEDSARNWLTSSTGEKAIWDVLGKNSGKLKGLVSK